MILVIAVAAGGVFALYVLSDQPNHIPNGFTRKLNTSFISFLWAVPTDNDIYHIVGATQHHIYLSTLRYNIFLDINVTTKKAGRDTLINFNSPVSHVPFQMSIDSPAITIAVGNFRKIYRGDLSSHTIYDSLFTPHSFIRSCPVNHHTFIFSAFDTGKKPTLIFEKLNTTSSALQKGNLFPKNNDDIIARDGLLQYDPSTRMLIYSLFYESHFIGMDTNMNLQFDTHTIDTFHINHTTGGFTNSSQKSLLRYTSVSPRYTLNANFSVFGGLVYIQSRLKADNDSESGFLHNTIIDVYDSNQKGYLYSFYIPRPVKEKIMDFKVTKGRLLVLYPTHLELFSLQN